MNQFWQTYGAYYNPANSRQMWFWALLYAGLSFAATPHWSSYFFAIMTTTASLGMIADRLYLRWRFRSLASQALVNWIEFVQHLHEGKFERASALHQDANCTCVGCMGEEE